MDPEYVIYGAPISLFTRKLEAAFRFYGAPFRMEQKTAARPYPERSRQMIQDRIRNRLDDSERAGVAESLEDCRPISRGSRRTPPRARRAAPLE